MRPMSVVDQEVATFSRVDIRRSVLWMKGGTDGAV